MVFVKKRRFFNLFFSYKIKIGQEEMFFEGSERKEAFLHHKKHRLKKPPKIFIFSKRLVHGFCQKMEIF